ncbi:hypothetical protein DFH06DRAFT_1221715 [Mycena polygramma]|nr:hypothetical protein DFH06DRAFT_1221715 [Mycena polygramma]
MATWASERTGRPCAGRGTGAPFVDFPPQGSDSPPPSKAHARCAPQGRGGGARRSRSRCSCARLRPYSGGGVRGGSTEAEVKNVPFRASLRILFTALCVARRCWRGGHGVWAALARSWYSKGSLGGGRVGGGSRRGNGRGGFGLDGSRNGGGVSGNGGGHWTRGGQKIKQKKSLIRSKSEVAEAGRWRCANVGLAIDIRSAESRGCEDDKSAEIWRSGSLVRVSRTSCWWAGGSSERGSSVLSVQVGCFSFGRSLEVAGGVLQVFPSSGVGRA